MQMCIHQSWAAFTITEIVVKGTDNYTLYVFHFNKCVFAVGLLFLPIYTIETVSFIINESIWNQSNTVEGFYNEGKGDSNNSVL